MQLIVIGGWHCLVGGGVFFGLLGFFMLVYLHLNLKWTTISQKLGVASFKLFIKVI